MRESYPKHNLLMLPFRESRSVLLLLPKYLLLRHLSVINLVSQQYLSMWTNAYASQIAPLRQPLLNRALGNTDSPWRITGMTISSED